MWLPERRDGECRIGVSLHVPEPYGSRLRAARASFGDAMADAIPPHITLVPPTVIGVGGRVGVVDHLAGVAAQFHPFTIRLRGTGTFRPVSAVVFLQVAQGIADCERLERAARSGPLAQELRFNYHPHVTIAHDLDEDALDRAFETCTTMDFTFLARGFHLYEHGDDGVWRQAEYFALDGA